MRSTLSCLKVPHCSFGRLLGREVVWVTCMTCVCGCSRQCAPRMQVRSAKLADLPLTALELLPPSGSEGLHPIVLSACYDNKVRP